jgi:hypothetical protein
VEAVVQRKIDYGYEIRTEVAASIDSQPSGVVMVRYLEVIRKRVGVREADLWPSWI